MTMAGLRRIAGYWTPNPLAATPWKGADAVAAMAALIGSLRHQTASLPVHPDMGPSTAAFGRIEGGSRPYAVPGSCNVTVDLRLVPPADTALAIAMVSEAMEAAKKEVPGVTADYRITGNRPCVVRNREM